MSYPRRRDRPRGLMRGRPASVPTRKASRESELMLIARKDVPLVTPVTPIAKLIEYMSSSDVRRIPVVSGNKKILGAVSLITVIDYIGGGQKSKIILYKYNGSLYKALNAPVEIIMEHNPVTIDLNASIEDAFKVMKDNNVGTVIIVNSENVVVGVLTERDILKAHANKLSTIKVSDIMTRNVITVKPETTVIDACRLMVSRGFRRLPVTIDKRLVGMFTAMDLLRFIAMKEVFRLIIIGLHSEIFDIPVLKLMRTDIITIRPENTISEAASLMLERDVGSLPVIENNTLVGIITERDFFKVITS